MMKIIKILISLLISIMFCCQICFAIELSEQIKNAKCVSEYDERATINDFDTVIFGEYPQSSSFSKEPIEWIVLKKNENEALLVSKYILDQIEYSNNNNSYWNDSYIRQWLNSTFIDRAFQNEKSKIHTTYLSNEPYGEWVDTGVKYDDEAKPKLVIGKPDGVKIFLLSYEDIELYMPSLFNRRTKSTKYANNNIYLLRDVIYANILSVNTTKNGQATGKMEYQTGSALAVNCNRSGIITEVLFRVKTGVRPAMWVKIDGVNMIQETNKKAEEQAIDYKKKNEVGKINNGNVAENNELTGNNLKKNEQTNKSDLKENSNKKSQDEKVSKETTNISKKNSVDKSVNSSDNKNKNGTSLYQFSFDIDKVKCVGEYDDNTTIDKIETVKFGAYPQKNKSSKDPIEWVVLEKKEGKALLLSKYILDTKRYDERDIWDDNCNYFNSSIREGLNNKFYLNAFNDEEKELILENSEVNNDKVFPLSVNECVKYFNVKSNYYHEYPRNKKIATKGTNYAQNGAEQVYWSDTKIDWEKHKLVKSTEGWSKGNSRFWLRTNSSKKNIIDFDGAFYTIPTEVSFTGVRPAMWVKYEGPEYIVKEITINEDDYLPKKPDVTFEIFDDMIDSVKMKLDKEFLFFGNETNYVEVKFSYCLDAITSFDMNNIKRIDDNCGFIIQKIEPNNSGVSVKIYVNTKEEAQIISDNIKSKRYYALKFYK